MNPAVLGLTALLALAVGLSLGLLGGGGSILTVPLLVVVAGVEPREAVTTSLIVVGVTAAAGLLRHARQGRVVWGTGFAFGLAGMVGAWLGGRASSLVSARTLLFLFTAMMLLTAVMMLRGRRDLPEERTAPHPLRIARDGVLIGFVTGLVGAGGGFLIVPALTMSGGLGMREAIGTSLFVIGLQAAAGFAGHAADVDVDVTLAVTVSAAAVLGSVFGAALSDRFHPETLRRGFALFVLVLGVVQLGYTWAYVPV